MKDEAWIRKFLAESENLARKGDTPEFNIEELKEIKDDESVMTACGYLINRALLTGQNQILRKILGEPLRK